MVTSSISSSSVNVSQTHQRPKPEDIFKKMDTDGSGGVSKEEFESAFVQISQKGGQAADGAASTDTSALKAKADEIYAKMDTDGDGSLSASEFQTAAKAQEAQHAERGHGGHHGSGGGGASGASSSTQKTYDPADTNKDGVVSTQEAAVYKTQQAAQQAQEAVKTYTDVQATS